MIQVCKSGRNPTMRHLGRTHKVGMHFLYERFAEPEIHLKKVESEKQAADIFTKPFPESCREKWLAALSVLGIAVL